MRLLRPFLCAALACAVTLSAQQAAPLDAKTQQQYERLLRHRYSRDLSEVFAAMEKSARPDARAGADARFLSAFRLGDWAQVRAELASLPPELGRGIYDKMLNDLAERPKMRNNPSLSGRVAVRFVVGRDGSVSSVGNGGSDLPDGGVVSCVVNSFRGLSFPAPDDGIVTVGYAKQFSPG